MLQQDHLNRIVNVQWGGAVEIKLNAAVTNPNVAVPHANALAISGWVWVPTGTPINTYPLIVFGGYGVPGNPIGGISFVSVTVRSDGFEIDVNFEGVPFLADPLVPDYPGFDYVGWYEGLTESFAPGAPAQPIPIPEDKGDGAGPGIGGLCTAGSGFTIAPFEGCFRIPTDEAILAQGVAMGTGQPLFALNQWHHFIASCDTGGLAHWGDQTIGAFLFVNGENKVEYFPGFFGLVLAGQVGAPANATFVAGTGISINGRPAGIPRPSTQLGDWTQTPIRFCDWQIYPRLVNPFTDIGKFFVLDEGVRKRVRTQTAADAFGVPVGSPSVKRPLWLFKGGGGSFHKSGPRSTDGEFVKTGTIITVPPPPMWTPPA